MLQDVEFGDKSYSDGTLNGLIAENISLLRNVFGESLDDVYEGEFGKRFIEGSQREPEDAGQEVTDLQAKNKVLGDRASELDTALKSKISENKELKEQFERSKRTAQSFKYQYDTLCSDFAKNSNHRMEHYNLLEKFNELSAALRQAQDTNKSLKAKLQLREQVLEDADRINQVVGDLETEESSLAHNPSRGSSSSFRRAEGIDLGRTSASAQGVPSEEGDKQFFYLADSAATALEMERLRMMIRKVGERLKEAEEERQAVSKSTALMNMELDKAEEAKRKVLVEIALAQNNSEVPPVGGGGSSNGYFRIPDLDAMKEENEKEEAIRMEALEAQLEKRRQQKEERVKRAQEWKVSLRQEELKREELAKKWKEEELRQASARKEQQKRMEELKQKELKLEELTKSRIKELRKLNLGREEENKEEILRNFVDSLTPDKVTTPERLISVSPDSDFSFPATLEKHFDQSTFAEVDSAVPSSAKQALGRSSKAGTPASEIQIDGIQTDLANRILSKASRSVGTLSSDGTPTSEYSSRSPKKQLKASPITRMRVPKSLTIDDIVARLEEIDARRSHAFETMSTDDVHLLAEEELEEKVLKRRLKKLRRRARQT